MTESAPGRTVTCAFAGPGALLGLTGIVGNKRYNTTAMARVNSEVRFVTRRDFEDMMRGEPSLSLFVSQMLAAEVEIAPGDCEDPRSVCP